jgi:hypothetical protein
MENEERFIRIYCCKVDSDYHIPFDYHGISFYFSEDSLRANRKCVEGCGIASYLLDMHTREIVQPENMDRMFEKARSLDDLIEEEYVQYKKELTRVISRLRSYRKRKERKNG